MMLEDAFGLSEEAKSIRNACENAIANGICTEDIFPGSTYGTKEVGQYIVNQIK